MEFLGTFLGLLTAMSTPSTATTTAQEILQATSDAFTGNLDLQIVIDDNDTAVGMQAVINGTTQEKDLTGLAQGIVLFTYSGKNVVTITSTTFDPSQGGAVDVSYLHNGVTGEYDNLTVDIERSGTTWQMLTDDQTGRNVVTHGYFKANKLFGKVIGIDTVTLTP